MNSRRCVLLNFLRCCTLTSSTHQERENLSAQAKDQVTAVADGLHILVQHSGVPLFSWESGLGVLVDALRRRLEK